MGEWISVKDRLPDEKIPAESYVLIHVAYGTDEYPQGGDIDIAHFRHGHFVLRDARMYEENYITHWMRIPWPERSGGVKQP